MIVLACLGSSHTANQLIVILEIVIIELRRNLPGLLLVVQTQVERSQTVVCLLILVVVFGAVESIGTIALASNTQLGDDVETLVVREREIAVALSLLEVAVLRAAIRALVASAYGISLGPLARFKSCLNASLCSEASKASAFYTCRYPLTLSLLGYDVDGTIEG